ncbi:TetR/AcrR family transcriptional regulator [Rhodococcoides yunnanense]|uniref:TetR/AcrR family transcriptional regulator n=1 Tax=Rhodococcoides yunnanense TaxID=278209 RepID=UPI0011149AFC|nr:TetR/AcrR family transcriptional regulator [Rhodococcus yunnanensis]
MDERQTQPDWSTKRADARANHERILVAAVELFAENGVGATIPQIAERAGVGKATVYRSYPTKQDLVAAVASFQLDWFDRYINEAAERSEDPYGTLHTLFHGIVDRLARDRSLAESLPRMANHSAAFDSIIAAGQQQGSVRQDVSAHDVRVLFGGVSRVLFDQGEHSPTAWHRYADLILNAIAEPAVTLENGRHWGDS